MRAGSRSTAVLLVSATMLAALVLLLLVGRKGDRVADPARSDDGPVGDASLRAPPTGLRDAPAAATAGKEAAPQGRIVGTVVLARETSPAPDVSYELTAPDDAVLAAGAIAPGSLRIDYPFTPGKPSILRLSAPGHRDARIHVAEPVRDLGTVRLVPALSYRGLVTNAADLGGLGVEVVLSGQRWRPLGRPVLLDAQGRFRIDTDLHSLSPNVGPDGAFEDQLLTARQIGGRGVRMLPARPSGYFGTHELELHFTERLVLEVLAPDGGPVPGVDVRWAPGAWWTDEDPAVRRAVTDERGRCAMTWPQRAWTVRLRVGDASTGAWGLLRWWDLPEDGVVVVRLPDAGGILPLLVDAPWGGPLGAQARLLLTIMFRVERPAGKETASLALGLPLPEAGGLLRVRLLDTTSFGSRLLPRSLHWSASYLGSDARHHMAAGEVAPVTGAGGGAARIALPATGEEPTEEHEDLLWVVVRDERGQVVHDVERLRVLVTRRRKGTSPLGIGVPTHVPCAAPAAGRPWPTPFSGTYPPRSHALDPRDVEDVSVLLWSSCGPVRRARTSFDAWTAGFDPATPLTLTVGDASTLLRVHAVASSGRPASFAEVVVAPWCGPYGSRLLPTETRVADASGRAWALVAEPSGPCTILARSQDALEMGSTTVETGREDRDVSVTLRPGVELRTRLAFRIDPPIGVVGRLWPILSASRFEVSCRWDARTHELVSARPVVLELYELQIDATTQRGEEWRTRRSYRVRMPAAQAQGETLDVLSLADDAGR